MTTNSVRHGIPEDILALSHERDQLRKRGHYDRADDLKKLIEEAGYGIKDNPHGAHLVILPGVDIDGTVYRLVRQIPSLLTERDTVRFSVLVLVNNRYVEARRCIESIFLHATTQSLEVQLIDNASQDELGQWARAYHQNQPALHVITPSRVMGEAEARNLGLKQSRGQYILQLDPSVELTGDIFSPLAELLEQPEIGIVGPRGLRTGDLRHFDECSEDDHEVESIPGQCMAFPRKLLKKIGLYDEGYRFPSFLDIDFVFGIRDHGEKAIVARDLPLILHPMQENLTISDAERTRSQKRNFYRFLGKWGDREDLLLDGEQDEEEYEEE
jgi:glycosyltransferase involved in cell wall biosynthesis